MTCTGWLWEIARQSGRQIEHRHSASSLCSVRTIEQRFQVLTFLPGCLQRSELTQVDNVMTVNPEEAMSVAQAGISFRGCGPKWKSANAQEVRRDALPTSRHLQYAFPCHSWAVADGGQSVNPTDTDTDTSTSLPPVLPPGTSSPASDRIGQALRPDLSAQP
jgi:hypothetical protein